jgi:hypothetical protein
VIPALGLISLAVTLSGCSTSAPALEGGAVASVSPSPTPPPVDPTVAWADGICGAAFGIRENIQAIGEDLAFDPVSAVTAGDQIRASLSARSDAIGQSVENLGTQIGKVPVDVSEAAALATTFEAEYAVLAQSSAEAQASIAAVTSASDIVTFGLNATQAIAAVRTASEATGSLAKTIGGTATGAQGSVSEAFAASTVCVALVNGSARPAQ